MKNVNVVFSYARSHCNSPRYRYISALLFMLVFFSIVPRGWAQITNVTDVTSTPARGAGHDYIGTLSETVNPANGSVSLRVQVPVLAGRALTDAVQLRL